MGDLVWVDYPLLARCPSNRGKTSVDLSQMYSMSLKRNADFLFLQIYVRTILQKRYNCAAFIRRAALAAFNRALALANLTFALCSFALSCVRLSFDFFRSR